ncbi:MAG: hypothetical protein WA441_00365 [Methyloceanibacter sp.]|jgi:hypothetical protein
MQRGCACLFSGADITRTIEVVKGTLSSGRFAIIASPTMATMPHPPPIAVMRARYSILREIIEKGPRQRCVGLIDTLFASIAATPRGPLGSLEVVAAQIYGEAL